jgi:CBS domain containing-hemolysin-like protein
VDDPLIWAAVLTAVLSGFFSVCAYALRGCSRRKLDQVFGPKHEALRESLIAKLSDLQMVCALLRALSNLALLAVLLYGLAPAGASGGWLLWPVLIAAVVISIVSVAVPHAWAKYSAESILLLTARPLLILRKLLLPLVVLMRAVDWPVRRLSGAPEPVNGNGEADAEAKEDAVKAEILHVASEGAAEGAVDDAEMEMIESVMEFSDTQAAEIMTPRTDIIALPAAATPAEVRETVVGCGHTRIPVHDGDIDNIIGVLHAKDLLAVEEVDRLELRKIMRKPLFVPETKQLDELLREFKARKVHIAIVLDEYGGTAGIVTVEDLIEEIVGDIVDEYDAPESPLLKRIDERTIEIDGRLHIDDLNDATGLDLPEDEDYDTVAGLVFSELGAVPEAGQTLTIHGANFTILAADDRKIIRLQVEVLQPQETQK